MNRDKPMHERDQDGGQEIVCRCEEVTREEIMEAIAQGACTLDDIKKRTRAGMGFCQGRTCRRLVARILSAYYQMPVDRFLPGSIRVPVTPIRLSLLAETVDGDLDEADRGETL